LARYYRSYDKKELEETYNQQANEILTHFQNNVVVLPSEGSATNRIKRKLGQVNLQRLAFTFGRLDAKESLKLASALKLLERLENFGIHIDADNVAKLIDGPGAIFNALSVALFAFRFLINASMIIKHTLYPTIEEKELTCKERLYKELYDRHYHLLNDLAWMVANFICNYNAVCHISDAATGWITLGFLVFDLTLLLIELNITRARYEKMKSQYSKERAEYESRMSELDNQGEDFRKCQEHCKILDMQLEQLELEWEKNYATLSCDIAAALLLGCGWTAALLIASPIAIVVSYFVCSIAFALYISDGVYAKYIEKAFILQKHEVVRANDIEALRDDKNKALNDLIKSVAKNTIAPMLLVSIVAISWPAALLLSMAYIANELGFFERKETSPLLARSAPPRSEAEDESSLEHSRRSGI
jgi:hypothetical protein